MGKLLLKLIFALHLLFLLPLVTFGFFLSSKQTQPLEQV